MRIAIAKAQAPVVTGTVVNTRAIDGKNKGSWGWLARIDGTQISRQVFGHGEGPQAAINELAEDFKKLFNLSWAHAFRIKGTRFFHISYFRPLNSHTTTKS